MGFDMRGFKMIYKERVYNIVWAEAIFTDKKYGEIGMQKPEFIEIFIVNEDGELCVLYDKATEFQFIRITQ